MPLDTSLLAVRSGEFSLPSTSANELLAQANLKQKQQEIESQNALRKATQGLDLNTPEGQQAYVNALRAGGYHSEAQDFVNKLATQKKTEAETQATQMDIFNKNKDTISKLFLDAASNPSDENLIAHANTAVTLGLDKDMVGGMLSDIFTLPPEQRAAAIRNFGLSAEKQAELNKPVDTEPKFGTYQPGDYTTASWAKFTTTKNPADLQLKPTAPGTSVNVGVSTAKGIAENVGDIAKTSRTQATGAIKTMTSANEIRNALNSGLVIAGPTADLQMKFNQLLTEAGKGSPEKSKQLAQTRTAIINLSKLTLAARAELQGSGAISDFETKLLERAQSGDINDMSVEELQTVVDAAQKGAQFLWGEHQGLLDTMKSDPETAKLARYYTPASKMPEAAGRTSTTTAAGAKAMPTGDKLKTYADQHFNGDQAKAKAFLSTQGYK